jgi:hypothetical protein
MIPLGGRYMWTDHTLKRKQSEQSLINSTITLHNEAKITGILIRYYVLINPALIPFGYVRSQKILVKLDGSDLSHSFAF